jgi:hypothetical protein
MSELGKVIGDAVQTRGALVACRNALRLCVDRLQELPDQGGPEGRHAIKKAKEALGE